MRYTPRCYHCKGTGFEDYVAHERACPDNPDNLPDMECLHSCGHLRTHKPTKRGVEGMAERAAFERQRLCTSCFLVEYRKAQANRTPEQIAEQRAGARAAFGPGETVTNILTGETYRT